MVSVRDGKQGLKTKQMRSVMITDANDINNFISATLIY